MPAGRPEEYKPEYCERVIELGKDGCSVVQMACHLGVVKQTLHNWSGQHEEFLDAFTRAKQHSQCWWEAQGQKGIWSRDFNAPAWSRSMAARFPDDYTEKHKTEHSGKVSLEALVAGDNE
jgi:hypothetical protein